MNKKTVIIIVVIAGVAAMCACVAVAGFLLYRTGKQTTDVVNQAATQIAATLDASPKQSEPVENPAVTEPTAAPTSERPLVTSFSSEDPQPVADQFMVKLRDKKYDEAAALMFSSMRDDPSMIGQLRAVVEDKGLEADTWTWLKTDDKEGKITDMTGAVHYMDKGRGSVEIELAAEDGHWTVNYINLQRGEGTTDPGKYATWDEARKQEEFSFAEDSATNFMTYWKLKDYNTIMWLSSTALRESVGSSPDKMKEYMDGFGLVPDVYSFSKNTTVTGTEDDHPVVVVNGTLFYNGGTSTLFRLRMTWENGYWYTARVEVQGK